MPTDPTTIPGWAWMPGMLTSNGDRVIRVFPKARQIEIDDLDDACHGERGECDAHLDRVPMDGHTLDYTDPATAGCLLALLGPDVAVTVSTRDGGPIFRLRYWIDDRPHTTTGHDTLGAACIAVAEALGRWPGGAS